MRHALAAGALAAAMCSYVGVYVVLKRIVFVGITLAELSSAGVALALLLGFSPMIGALGLMLVGVVLFSVRWSPSRVSEDSFIGIGYAVAAALGVLLVAKSAKGEAHILELFYGNVLTVSPRETLEMLCAFTVVALVYALLGRRFIVSLFDPDFAETIGYRPRVWNLVFYLTIGVVIAYAMRSVGVLLTFAMLVIPGTVALLLTSRLKHAFVVAIPVGVLPVIVGIHLSLAHDLPSSAAIVATAFPLLILALAYRSWVESG